MKDKLVTRLRKIRECMGGAVVFRIGIRKSNKVDILSADFSENDPDDRTEGGPSIEEVREIRKKSYIG